MSARNADAAIAAAEPPPDPPAIDRSEDVENGRGDRAWTVFAESVAQGALIANGAEVAGSRGRLDRNLVYAGRDLYWVRGGASGPQLLCKLGRDGGQHWRRLDLLPDAPPPRGGGTVALAGLDPERAEYRLFVYGAAPVPLVDEPSAEPLVAHGGRIWRVRADPALLPLLWFAKMADTGPDDEWASCGNHHGRISWTLAYRLEAYGLLLERLNAPRLRERAERLASTLIENEAPTGSFVTTKFSTDRRTPHHFAVTDAHIAYGMMKLRPALSPARRAGVDDYVRRVVRRHDAAWRFPHYHFPPDVPIPFPGEPLPYNQEHALGLVLIELAATQGDASARERAAAMLDAFEADLIDSGGAKVWRYWPSAFYRAGAGPSREWGGRFDDTAHGAIVADFVGRASALLGRRNPLDLEALAAGVRAKPLSYRQCFGDPDKYAGSICHAPLGPFAETAAMQHDLRSWLPRPMPNFNNQHLTLGYARAAIAALDRHGPAGAACVAPAFGDGAAFRLEVGDDHACRLHTPAGAGDYDSVVDAAIDLWRRIRVEPEHAGGS